jgi:hypothetical protein
MTSSPRITRTPPERGGPIRNPMSTRPDPGSRNSAPGDPIGAAGAAVYGALENGVRTAYAVIDEYMRRGQETARTMFNDPYKRGPMNDDKGNFGGGYNPWNPMSMFTEQWMMAMRMWSQAWSGFMPPGWQQPGMNPFASAQTVAPGVSIKVSSPSSVEAALKLYPGLDFAGLVAESLRADEAASPAIEAPSIARESGTIHVSLKIGANQPKGSYRGNIRKETDKSVVGEMIVTIS